jgi:transcriptional regulator NrdR family protein
VDLKQQLMNQALRLMQDPRVMKALQNPKLMQGLMGAVQLRAKVQQRLESNVQKVAKRLSLATEAEVRELRRTIRKLEREVEAQKSARHDATAARGAAR